MMKKTTNYLRAFLEDHDAELCALRSLQSKAAAIMKEIPHTSYPAAYKRRLLKAAMTLRTEAIAKIGKRLAALE